MEILHLSKPDRQLRGHIALDGSKSLSNRALIALALAGADPAPWLRNLSTSKDTQTLVRLLAGAGDVYDAGDAGTTFRFLTAFLALQPGTQILTGSTRMRERPVGPLVQALRSLGADIQCTEKEGYPPLRIGPPDRLGLAARTIRVDAHVSSQFLSALLLIAPYLPQGLELIPNGALVSRPYLEMTIRMMRYFGAAVEWQGDAIHVAPGAYTPRPLSIEADWSAASYWYALAALADEAELTLDGLSAGSWQGDAVLAGMMPAFGIQTDFIGAAAETPGRIVLKKEKIALPPAFEWNFLECPDIAQTLAVVCAGLGVAGVFTGLETLAIKETDRTAALQTELGKVCVSFEPMPPHLPATPHEKNTWLLHGKAGWKTPPRFSTYGDHRMAMAFAPLAMLAPVDIETPDVVRKSYPMFWKHLAQAGFTGIISTTP